MNRYSEGIGPKALVSITAIFLAIGVATLLVLFNTVSANPATGSLEEASNLSWPRGSASPTMALDAIVTVPLSTVLVIGGTGASVTVAIDVLDVPSGDLGAYQFKIAYDTSVITATAVLGGDSPFSGVTASNITTPVTGVGVVTWNSFQGGSVSVSAAITVANVVFEPTGSVGDCTALDLTVEELVDNSAVAISNTHQDGELCLVEASAIAETDLVAVQDVDDAALPTGVKATIDLLKDPTTGNPLPSLEIDSYEANITFSASLAVATECRLKTPINAGVADCSISPGQVHLEATRPVTASGTVAPFDPLAFVALRLIGSNDSSSGLTVVNLNFVEIRDEFGGLVVQEAPPDTRTFLRGDALANGNISISDALFIGQHLVAPLVRPVGEGGGEVNPVNAGSVKHDSPNDVISLADAILIAQFLVGNLDEFYNPIT